MERKKVTISALNEKKQQGVKTTNIVCYDYIMGSLVDQAGIDTILVGDSAEMVMMGNPNTLAVSVDEMIYHCKGVMRAVNYAFVVGDMPFLSYQTGTRDAIYNAGLFMKHAGVDAVKLEGGREVVPIIRAISDAGIPVVGDIGLTPESLAKLEGSRIEETDAATARKLMDDALALEAAGVFCLDLKFVPDRLAKVIAKKLRIPVYGFACGPDTDGQFLNIYDLLGMLDRAAPKYVKEYGNLSQQIVKMMKSFMEDVQKGAFPGKKHSYHIEEEVLKKVLDDWG